MNEGWICPVCKAVWAPFVATCTKPHDGTGAAKVPAMGGGPWSPPTTGTTAIHVPFSQVTYVSPVTFGWGLLTKPHPNEVAAP